MPDNKSQTMCIFQFGWAATQISHLALITDLTGKISFSMKKIFMIVPQEDAFIFPVQQLTTFSIQ